MDWSVAGSILPPVTETDLGHFEDEDVDEDEGEDQDDDEKDQDQYEIDNGHFDKDDSN